MKTNQKSFGEELKSYRELKKLTLREVEELSGISNAYLSQLENDKIKHPSANVLYNLAKVYDIHFDILLEAAGIIQSKSAEERKNGPKTLSGHALYSDELTREEEEELVKYLKYLRFKGKNEKK